MSEGGASGGFGSIVGALVRGITRSGSRFEASRQRSAQEHARLSASIREQYGPHASIANAARVATGLRRGFTPLPSRPTTPPGGPPSPTTPTPRPRPAPTPTTPPGSSQPAPAAPDPWPGRVQLLVELLNLLRAFGVRLPGDPKPPRPVVLAGGDTFLFGGDFVPYSLTSGEFGNNTLAGLGSLASGIAGVINAIRSPQSMPGGAFVAGAAARAAVPWILGGAAAGVGGAVLDAALTPGSGCPTSPFVASQASSARASTFVVAHPVTGKPVWFKPAGRPILWSGDLSACRRVRKIAGRARRRLGGR